jgi:hypothetical protein
VTIKRNRKRVYRPTAADKEAASKESIKSAYANHSGPLPRTPPSLIRNALTKKWTRWEEVDPADHMPDALVPSIEGLAGTLNAAVDGAARKAGKTATNSKTRAVAQKYEAAKARFVRIGQGELLKAPFSAERIDAIERTAKAYSIRLPCKVKSFVRGLQRRAQG